MKQLTTILIIFAAWACCQPPVECPECNNDTIIVHQADTIVMTDTITWFPQCTLCYESIDTVNDVQYYVGYDGRYYKLYKDSATIIRQMFVNWKDTTIIRYQVRDSIVTYINYIDTTQFFALKITGHGTPCNGVYGTPILSVNGSRDNISAGGSFTLDEQDNEYIFNVGIPWKEVKTITINWDGDCYAGAGNDRNVFIKSVDIKGANYLTADKTTFTGSVKWWGGYAYFSSNGSLTITK